MFGMKIFTKDASGDFKEEKSIEPATIYYGDRVCINDGFYNSAEGIVIGYEFKESRYQAAWSTTGTYWETIEAKYYKIKLKDGNEILVPAGFVVKEQSCG
jgi:co-chaperonin GroES (HSP10)